MQDVIEKRRDPNARALVAEVRVVVHHSPRERTCKAWRLSAAPATLVIGTQPSCDFVIEDSPLAPKECQLRWDGRALLALSADSSGRPRSMVVPLLTPVRIGSVELILQHLPRASRLPEPEEQTRL